MHLMPCERLNSARVRRASSPGYLLCRKHPYPPLSLTEARGLPHNYPSAGGRVAQLGEHLLCKQGVGGSNPSTSTNYLPAISLAYRPTRSVFAERDKRPFSDRGVCYLHMGQLRASYRDFRRRPGLCCALDNGRAPKCLPLTSIGSIGVRVPRRSCRLAWCCSCLSHSWEWPLQERFTPPSFDVKPLTSRQTS